MNDDRTLLRHTVATLAYRGGKCLRDAPPGFGDTRVASDTRSAGEILAHLGDLLDWALSMAKGENQWNPQAVAPWPEGVARFHAGLAAFDAFLASDAELAAPAERLFQGPIADVLTHVGQIATLRRIAGAPVKGENYFKADIEIGRVGPEQPVAKREF